LNIALKKKGERKSSSVTARKVLQKQRGKTAKKKSKVITGGKLKKERQNVGFRPCKKGKGQRGKKEIGEAQRQKQKDVRGR